MRIGSLPFRRKRGMRNEPYILPEHQEHYYCPDDIKQDMGQGSTLCVTGGSNRCQTGGDACAYVVAKDNRYGFFKREDTIVFLHTGGPVALFPYRETLKAHIRGDSLPWVIPEWSTRAG